MKKTVRLFLSWLPLSGGLLMAMSGECVEPSKKDVVMCVDKESLAKLCDAVAHDGAGLIALHLQRLSLADETQEKSAVQDAKKKSVASVSR